MSTEQEILRAKRHKQKLLKKYLSANQGKPSAFNNKTGPHSFIVKDHDEISQQSQLQDQESSSEQIQNRNVKKRQRIESSDQQNDDYQKLKQKSLQQQKLAKEKQQGNSDILHNKKLRKKFKKAFGIDDDQQLHDFLKEMKIQGMDIKEIKKLLKSKKVQLKVQKAEQGQNEKKERKKNKKEKKKAKKQGKQQASKLKFQGMIQSSASSDIQVPDQARTIYRNKDGTIKTQTEAQRKQKQKQQVMDRLAEWQKGMKGQDSDADDNQDMAHAKNNVWDDPLKIWNEQNIVQPFQCKYQGPGNRFNIKPGYRWDGVIRGNGFQNKILQQQNLRKANQARQQRQYLKNL